MVRSNLRMFDFSTTPELIESLSGIVIMAGLIGCMIHLFTSFLSKGNRVNPPSKLEFSNMWMSLRLMFLVQLPILAINFSSGEERHSVLTEAFGVSIQGYHLAGFFLVIAVFEYLCVGISWVMEQVEPRNKKRD